MKYNRFFLFTFFLFGCKHSAEVEEFKEFSKFATEKNAIIISCNKCDCIISSLNSIFLKNNSLLQSYTIYGDSSCLHGLNKGIEVVNTNQSTLDSISTDFHNLLIIKKESSKYSIKMVNTNDAKDIYRFIQN